MGNATATSRHLRETPPMRSLHQLNLKQPLKQGRDAIGPLRSSVRRVSEGWSVAFGGESRSLRLKQTDAKQAGTAGWKRKEGLVCIVPSGININSPWKVSLISNLIWCNWKFIRDATAACLSAWG